MGPRAKLCGIAERNHGPGITGNLVIRMARAYGRADNDMLVETTVSLELQHTATSALGSTTQRSDRLLNQKLIPSHPHFTSSSEITTSFVTSHFHQTSAHLVEDHDALALVPTKDPIINPPAS